MKVNEVRHATAHATALADAFPDATTPIVVTASYLDASGRVVVARHTVGVAGWSIDAADNDVD